MNTIHRVFDSIQPFATSVLVPRTSTRLSYVDLESHAKQLAHHLLVDLHCTTGDAVCFLLSNGVEHVITFLATTCAQLVAAPLNPNYKKDEVLFYLKDVKPRVLLLHKGSIQADAPAVQAARQLDIPVYEVYWEDDHLRVLDPSKGVLTGHPTLPVVFHPLENQVALILHTSGTTGRPKGVPLTHGNIMTTVRNIIHTYRLTLADRTYLVMPLFHVHGLIGAMLSTLVSGGTIVLPTKFSAQVFWQDVTAYKATWYTAVPTMHTIMLKTPFDSSVKHHLRFVRSCSSSLAPATFNQLRDMFQGKVPILEAYAMTEAAHQIASNPFDKQVAGTVGIPQGVEVAILDDEGHSVRQGEVCIRGKNVTSGYRDNPQANATSFHAGGWFRTGDRGEFTADGYLTLTGRLKELINRGGEKISPVEVDQCIMDHPNVIECVSFGVEDAVYGQVVGVAIVARDTSTTPRDIQQWVKQRLGDWKVPARVWMVQQVPKTATGKVQRRLVKAYCDTLTSKL
jgi:acyl-CoA synthetase (AMP-forming)/AMP-acid ligase II